MLAWCPGGWVYWEGAGGQVQRRFVKSGDRIDELAPANDRFKRSFTIKVHTIGVILGRIRTSGY